MRNYINAALLTPRTSTGITLHLWWWVFCSVFEELIQLYADVHLISRNTWKFKGGGREGERGGEEEGGEGREGSREKGKEVEKGGRDIQLKRHAVRSKEGWGGRGEKYLKLAV